MGGGEDWRSLSVTDWYVEMKEGAIKHVIVSPFELYEMLMDVNKNKRMGDWRSELAQKEGRSLTRR